jgi:hypothetical protein
MVFGAAPHLLNQDVYLNLHALKPRQVVAEGKGKRQVQLGNPHGSSSRVFLCCSLVGSWPASNMMVAILFMHIRMPDDSFVVSGT